jgi:ABC-type sulfate/molybdate transport systems ATPase subunit
MEHNRRGVLLCQLVGLVFFCERHSDPRATFAHFARQAASVGRNESDAPPLGVAGPSGAGKSTLINLMQRLYDVQSGAVLIDGQPVESITQDSLRASLSVVPQEIGLFHRSVMENICFGREAVRRPTAAYRYRTRIPQRRAHSHHG